MQIDRSFLGGIASAQHTAFPQGLAVSDDFEDHTPSLAYLVIHTHCRREAFTVSVKGDSQRAVRMSAEPMLESLAIDEKRMTINRLVRSRFAPDLFSVLQFKCFNDERITPRAQGR